jgi:hypothetical protein
MEIQIFLNDKRQEIWKERNKKEITKNQSELDKIMPTFIELERDYLSFKSKVDEIKDLIAKDNEELKEIIHAQNFPADQKKKPFLTRSGEEVQQQVVKQKPKFKNTDTVPLKNIRWAEYFIPVLKKEGRFLTQKELWAKIEGVENTAINKSRFYAAFAFKHSKQFKIHDKKIGLAEWFEDGIPMAKFLGDFLNTKTA